MLKPFTYAIGTFIGIGVLILPTLFQQVGILLSTGVLLFAALLLLLLTFVIMDLIKLTKKNLADSVEEFLGFGKPAVKISLAVFTYGALVAYVIGAGNQLSALFGGLAQYWGTLFFVLAAIPIIQNTHIFEKFPIYLSLALLAVITLLIPINSTISNFVPLAFGDWSLIPILLSVSIFSLFGHFSIYEIYNMRKDDKSRYLNFLGAFFLSLFIYLLYAISSSFVGPMGDLSTVSLLLYHQGITAFIISTVAILAFYTSFVNISESFINPLKEKLPSGGVLVLLFFPTAVLYILIRQFGIMTLSELVARFCGVGILGFATMACVAHFRASRKFPNKTRLPGWVSVILSIIFVTIASFNVFMF